MHFRGKDGRAQFRMGNNSSVLGDLRAWSGVVAEDRGQEVTGEGEPLTITPIPQRLWPAIVLQPLCFSSLMGTVQISIRGDLRVQLQMKLKYTAQERYTGY